MCNIKAVIPIITAAIGTISKTFIQLLLSLLVVVVVVVAEIVFGTIVAQLVVELSAAAAVVVVAITVILVVVMVLNAQASQHNFKIDALFLCFRTVKFVRQS
jgi:hypothetical protein